MIFVILGMEKFSFDRLVKEVDFLKGSKKIEDSIFIQLGSCKYEPKHCECKRFLAFEETCEKIKKAEVVIAHAGAGTTLLCLQYGKKPILVPRRKQFGEHVDDHQVSFAHKMEKIGVAFAVFKIKYLCSVLQKNRNKTALNNINRTNKPKLINYLTSIIKSWQIR